MRGRSGARSACGAAAVALALVAAGCSRYYWSKPGSTADQFARDSQECAREATTVLGIGMQQGYRDCLTARGYRRAKQVEPPPPGSYRGIDDEPAPSR